MDNLKVGDTTEVYILGEICCDICEEICANYMDCPVCKQEDMKMDIGTDLYGEKDVCCPNCGSIFEFIGEGRYGGQDVKIIRLNEL